MEAYCFHCRSKKELKDGQLTVLRNGAPAIKGICYECGTQVFRTGRGAGFLTSDRPNPNCDQLNEKVGD
jgi:hypothetical protein